MNRPQIGLNANIGSVPQMSNGRHVLSGNIVVYIKNGQKHRLNGPAEIRPDGTKIWFRNGVKDRKNAPAVTKPDGSVEYWENGQRIEKD